MAIETDTDEINKRRGGSFILGIPIALLSFSHSLTGIVLTDLIIYRTCLVSLNINETECLKLRTNISSPEAGDLEAKVEPYASTIVMMKSLIESILPALLSVFLGSWSDQGGRRPLLLAGLTGFTSMFVMLSFMSEWNINPWYLLIPSIPACVMGGICTVILATVCYVSDTTTEENRMAYMAWLEASIFGGDVIGGVVGPSIYGNFGDTNVFRVAVICCTLALLYIYFIMPETVECSPKKSILRVFDISVVKELVTSSFLKRDGFHASVAGLAIFILTMIAMIDKGHATIEFLFTRARLSWNVQHYFYFNTTGVVLRIIGLFGVLLRSHVSDTMLAGVGLVSALASAVTKCLAWQSWHMYLSVLLGMFSGIVSSVIRSILSKVVPAQDIGKVFSLTTVLEVLSLLSGAPLYTFIYSHYLPPIYPSPVHLISISFLILLIFLLMRIEMLIKKFRKPPIYVTAPQEDLFL